MSRSCGGFLLAVILIGVVAIFLAVRPTPITGFDGGNLADSVEDGSLGGGGLPCKERSDGWSCSVTVQLPRGDSSYSVGRYSVDEPDWWGCWTAQREDPPHPGDGLESTLEGCITILDHW